MYVFAWNGFVSLNICSLVNDAGSFGILIQSMLSVSDESSAMKLFISFDLIIPNIVCEEPSNG